jgi:DNA-binding transcriptional LysR family regulator
VVVVAGTGAAGTLLVGYSPTARNEILPVILDEVGKRYPRLEILASENWAGCDALKQGTADIALVRFNEPDESRIHGAIIRESRVGLLLGHDDPCARRDRIRLEEMGDRPLEVPARRHSARFRDDLVNLLRGHGFTGEIREYHNLTSHFMLDDKQACERIISGATFGFGFEDQYPLLPEQLVWIPLEPELYAPMHVCWRDDATPAMCTFINLTLEISERLDWVRPAVRSTGRLREVDT